MSFYPIKELLLLKEHLEARGLLCLKCGYALATRHNQLYPSACLRCSRSLGGEFADTHVTRLDAFLYDQFRTLLSQTGTWSDEG